jgi:hypothetical protein
MNINYLYEGVESIDKIKPLWTNLILDHKEKSTNLMKKTLSQLNEKNVKK